MRKVGKYEKMRKRALLQTYMISLASLMLCVTMFLGTTMAWFTSDVTVENNEIYIGTLDVDMQDKDGNSFAGSDEKLFDSSIRWEPGYTALETIKVVNEGDLAFKYVLNFTDGKLAENSENSINAVAEHFDVWVYMHSNAAPNSESYADVNEENGWKYAGSLDQLLAGEPVLEGVMDNVRYEQITENTEETVPTNEGTTDGIPSEATYTIALHMKEDTTAQDTLMGQKISLTVKLVAYQMNSEEDAFDNTYDNQLVATAEQLKTALESGESVVLISDISLTDGITVPSDATVTLDLNGHTISQTKAQTAAYSMINNKGNLTISDSVGTGKISYADTTTYTADVNYASNTIRNEGVLNVTGGIIENTSSNNVKEYGYPHAIDVYQGSVTNIYGGTIKSANYDCIRMFCNSTTQATTVNIYGGNIINRVSFQNPGSNTAGYGILNIAGGTFTTTNAVSANVRLLNFSTDCSKMKATISGGTFDKGIMIQNHSSGTAPVMNDWITVTNLTLTEPVNGENLWKIG